MRKSILLLGLCTLAGCDAADPGYVILNDLVERSSGTRCEAVDLGNVAFDHVRSASDTTFIVLDAAQRRVTEFDQRLRPVRGFEYVEHGPAAVDRPQDVAALGDSAVAIATRGGLKLVTLDWDGDLLETFSLEFIPNAMTATPGGDVLIAAMPLGSDPRVLLYRYRDGVLDPLPVMARPYADMSVGAVGNSVLPLSLGGGEALAVHQIFAPRAFRVTLATGDVVQLPMPTPGETRDRIEFVPIPPIEEDDIARSLVPALDGAVDRGMNAVYILTKSGRTIDGVDERILMQLDDSLGYRASWTLGVSVSQMALLPRREAVVVADNADGIYLCELHDQPDAP